MSECYVSEHGLPRAVATIADLPKNAFVGHLCYVKATNTIYSYDGNSYSVATESGGGGAVSVVSTYNGKSNFPSNATAGQLAFSTNASTRGLYVYNGTTWEQVAITS